MVENHMVDYDEPKREIRALCAYCDEPIFEDEKCYCDENGTYICDSDYCKCEYFQDLANERLILWEVEK